MTTANYNLPLITGNMTADVPRDMNALAEATDEAIKEVEQRVDTHFSESASKAHGAVRKEYVLFSGMVTTGTVILDIPLSFTSIDDFDEVFVLGTLAINNSSTWRHFNEVFKPNGNLNTQSVSVGHEIIFPTTESSKYWLHLSFNKPNKTLTVVYNRSKIGNGSGVDGTENAVASVIGVKFD